MDSILTNGDGRSFATAFKVITIDEEYAVLQVLGVRKADQSLVEHGGSSFDLFTVNDPESGKEFTLYFNVDLPLRWLDASLAKPGEKPAPPPAPASPQDGPARSSPAGEKR